MAYIQNFKSLNGTTYTVQVDGVTLSTTPPLAATPFSTEEDGDTDVFTPVRTQTGYLRLMSTDLSTWRSLIPSGALAEPVMLKRGTDILWQGYVQTGTYGMAFPSLYEEVDIPLCCPLSVLECIQVDVVGPADMVSVGQLLNYIFSKLTGLSFYVCFSVGTSTYTTVPEWLQYKLVWRNFINKGTPATGRFSCLGLLQEVCKFFGWSCRTIGQGIYFTSAADPIQSDHFIRYTIAGLLTPSTGYTTVGYQTLALTDADFASNGHSEEFIPGYKSVTVNSELNAYNALVKMPSDEILKKYQYETPVLGRRFQSNLTKRYDCWILKHESVDFENEDVTITSYTEQDMTSSSPLDFEYGKLLIYDGDTSENKPRFGWTTIFEIHEMPWDRQRQNNTPLFSIESKDTFALGGGTLYVKGGADYMDQKEVSTDPTAVCIMRIGIPGNYKYWNGSAWSSSYATFNIAYTMQGIPNTRSLITEPEYEGTGMPISGNMFGYIYFAVMKINYHVGLFEGTGYIPIMNLEIGFARVGEDDTINDKSYMANGGLFPEEHTVDTIFTTDKTEVVSGGKTIHCELGYGMLFGNNGIVDTITFGDGTQKKPEQHCANVIAAFMNTSRQVLTLDLKTTAIGDVGPGHIVSYGGNTYIPISVSHDWREDISTIKMVKKS